MVAARILAYGGNYEAEVQNPDTGDKQKVEFDLTSCEFKDVPDDVDYSDNEFKLELPVTKINITYSVYMKIVIL